MKSFLAEVVGPFIGCLIACTCGYVIGSHDGQLQHPASQRGVIVCYPDGDWTFDHIDVTGPDFDTYAAETRRRIHAAVDLLCKGREL